MSDGITLGIGALARATGIPANTIRTWERRYGVPSPERTDGGHRVYSQSTVDHLMLVSEALKRGHRPARVLTLAPDQLHDMLGTVQSPEGADPGVLVRRWVRLAADMDPEGLDLAFRQLVAELGLRTFVKTYAPAFIEALGTAWAEGQLRVYHEHMASERLRDFLVANWWPLSREASQRDAVVCATLPGERHFLGLHLIACLAAMAGVRSIFLGLDTPVPELVACAERTRPRALLISCSRFSDPDQARAQLEELAASRPDDIEVIVGGAGALEVDGITIMRTLDELEAWLRV